MDREVKKHIAAIRISDNIGLLARKMWNVLLLNSYEDLLTTRQHKIPVNVLSEIVDYSSNDYSGLRASLKKLRQTDIEWDIGGGCTVNGKWCSNDAGSTMLAFSSIKDGVLTYEFSMGLSKLLYNPEMYQKISVAQQRLFKSSSSLALWENCIRFIGVGKTGFAEIIEWRQLLGATAKSYDDYKDFNKHVIATSVKEINFISNIEIELVTKRTGRKITHIGFNIKQKEQKQLAIPEILSEVKLSKEYEELLAHGINEIQAISWIQEYGYKYIREKIDFVIDSSNNGKVKSSISGLLVSAIKGDFKGDKQIIKKQKEKQIQKRNDEELEKKREDLKSKLSLEFSREEKEKFLSLLSEIEKEELKNKILKEDQLDSYSASLLKKKGLSSPVAGVWIIKKIPDFEKRRDEYIKYKLSEAGF